MRCGSLRAARRVRFDRTHHLMVVIGPQGANLKKDVDLRLENSATVL